MKPDHLRRQSDDAQSRAAFAQYDHMVAEMRAQRQYARNVRRMLFAVALVTIVVILAALMLK